MPFGSIAPFLVTFAGPSERTFAQAGPFPGGDTNPLNYPVEFVQLSNGSWVPDAVSRFGTPWGQLSLPSPCRIRGRQFQMEKESHADIWCALHTGNGRSDSQFPAIPELNALLPGLGDPVRQPNANFAPQLGFAWDPNGRGKTSIRGGIGLFYENVLTSVAPQDPLFRAPRGDIFLQIPLACNGTANPLPIHTPGGVLQPTFCSADGGSPVAIGVVGSQIAAFQRQYQAAFPFDLNASNPSYLGTLASQGLGYNIGGAPLGPDYRTPRSIEMNIGVEREIRPGMIFSADFVRNVQTYYFLAIDENDTGDVRYFNKAAL